MKEITSRKNPLAVHLRKLGADGAYRRQSGEFLCDGKKLLFEAIASGAEITAVLTCQGPIEGLPEGIQVYRTTRDVIEAVSPLKTPQEVVFTCRMAAHGGEAGDGGIRIVLEGVQDPGNVGTIIRTADAFGAGAVVLTGPCADPFHPKAVRASMGAIFRQRVEIKPDLSDIAALKEKGTRLYGACAGPGGRDVRDVPLDGAAVAIGSEGRGLTEEMLRLCDGTVRIPMSGRCESLNAAAAAAVIMWEAFRRR